MNKCRELYIDLLKETLEIKELMGKTRQYRSFLEYCDFNTKCIKEMFAHGIKPRQEYFQKIPSLEEECKQCWKYYISPRNKSIKKYDILYGKKFESAFIRFLNTQGIRSEKADQKNTVLPDNLIKNVEGSIVAYYEVKYHNAPFVWRYKYEPGRECYEGSITLDYEKVQKQIEAIRNLTNLPVYYLHWVDFPCIKGIYYMSLEDTQKELETGIAYARKEREGDYITSKGKKKKVGYQNKFYPSIISMNNLEQFIEMFR